MTRSSLAMRFASAVLLAATLMACGESPTAPAKTAPEALPAGIGSMSPFSPALAGALSLGSSPCAEGAGEFGFPSLSLAGSTVGIQTLGSLGGQHARAFGVNASGNVVGYSELSGSAFRHAFLWQAPVGPMKDLGVLPGYLISWANRINDNNWVVGRVANVNASLQITQQHGFLWKPGATLSDAGTMQDLAPLAGDAFSEATDINNAGVVVGYSRAAGATGRQIAVYWTPGGTAVPLGFAPGGTQSIAYGVNDAGDVSGAANGSPTGRLQAAKGKVGVAGLSLLGTPGATVASFAYDLNSSVVAAGYGTNAADQASAFRWSAGGSPLGLAGVPDAGRTIRDVRALAISPNGVAAGFTTYTDGSRNAQLWDTDAISTPIGKPLGACSAEGWDIAEYGKFEVVRLATETACDAPTKLTAAFTGRALYVAGMANFAGTDQALKWTLTDGPFSYVIDWGDGSTTTGTTPTPGALEATHDYAAPGTYTVTFTVTDHNGKSVSATTTATKPDCGPKLAVTGGTFRCGQLGRITAVVTATDGTGPFAYTIDWGDGSAPTTGSVASAGDIPADHEYAVSGTYAVTVTVTNAHGQSATATTSVVKEACPPVVSVVAPKAAYQCDEAGAIVASFTSSGDAGPYAYTIAWGDGSTTTGSAATAGDIPATHDYAPGDASYTVTVTVTNQFGESASATTTVVKEDCRPEVSVVTPKAAYECDEAGAIVASFTSSGEAGPYAYTIAWGDGSTSTGTAATPGDIPASHAYAPGAATYSVTVTVTNKFGESASATATVVKEACPPAVTVVTTKAAYACDEPGAITASFTSSGDAGPYAYTIDWGDGTTTTGSAATPGDIPASHDFAPGDGSFTVTVTVTNAFGESSSATTTVVKENCETRILTFGFARGDYACGEMASLSATFGSSSATAGPWHYVFAWGDGTVTEGDAIAPSTITATHKYLADGTYTASVTVTDRFGNAASSTTTVVQAPCPPKIEELLIVKPTIGCGEPAQVAATFSSNGATGPFAYTLSWGDGSPAQTGIGTPGEAIVGTHNYATNGSYTITFTVQGSKGPAVSQTVAVTRNCVPTPPKCDVCVLTPYTKVGQVVSVSSKFTDATGDGPWSYVIDWGDGQKSTGTVTALDNPITGTHTYATAGTYTVKVTVTDATGAAGNCASTVVVRTPPPLTVPRCDAGCSSTDYAKVGETVRVSAAFTDGTYDGPWSYTIDWGDGQKSTGTLSSLYYRINGSHVYATAGTYNIKITVTDRYGAAGDCYSKVVIKPPPPPTPPQCESCVSTAYTKVGQSVSVTSQFRDGGTDGPWTYEIDWGDGSPKTTGSKTSLYGGITGTHTYAVAGTFTITMKLVDRSGAVGTCVSKVVVNPPPPPSPPVCRTCTSNTYARAGESVSIASEFSDDANTGPYTYVIDWGDGTKTTGTKTSLTTAITGSHVYTAGGYFTIKVTVTDSRGVSGTCTSKVTVRPPSPPRCESCAGSASYAKVNRTFSLTSSFSDDSADGPWAYEIDWGDGTAKSTGTKTSLAYGITGSHTYTRTGTFTVKVKVTDRSGAVGTCTYTVTVRSY